VKKATTQDATPAPIAPRLMTLLEVAEYMRLSIWTIRAFCANGQLQPLRLPSVRYRSRPSRRVLVDKADVDALIEKCKRKGA